MTTSLETTVTLGHTHDYNVTRTIEPDIDIYDAVKLFLSHIATHFDDIDLERFAYLSVNKIEHANDGVSLQLHVRRAQQS